MCVRLETSPVSTVVDDYRIIIESTVLSQPYELTDAEMIPVAGANHALTYRVELLLTRSLSLKGMNYG